MNRHNYKYHLLQGKRSVKRFWYKRKGLVLLLAVAIGLYLAVGGR